MTHRRIHPTVWMIPLLLTGCGEGSNPADVMDPAEQVTVCTDDTGSVEVTVGPGQTPTIDWSPKCAVAIVRIQDAAADVWGFSTLDVAPRSDIEAVNALRPPIAWADTPTGAQSVGSGDPLVPGREYSVYIWRLLPPESRATCLSDFEGLCLLAEFGFTR